MESTKVKAGSNTAVDPTAPSSPTTTFYQQIADQLSAAITQTIDQIPGYHDDLSGLKKNTHRLVPPAFVAKTVSAVVASEELAGVKQLDVGQTRDSAQFKEAFEPLMTQLRNVEHRLGLLILAKDVKIGRDALGVYNIAKRLVQNSNNTHLTAHVADLKAELKRKRPAKQPKTAPAPAKTPAAPPVSQEAAGAAKGGESPK
jgi:hypothetical protein